MDGSRVVSYGCKKRGLRFKLCVGKKRDWIAEPRSGTLHLPRIGDVNAKTFEVFHVSRDEC